MIRSEFAKQYSGNFDDERSAKIEELANRYHAECESYDRRVCTGRNDRGVAIPLSPHEQGLIGRNATNVRERIVSEATCHGITWREIQNAMRQGRSE